MPPRGNRRRRRRNITYFCLPFSRILETKLGNQFLRAIDESFPVGNEHHGKINRHNIKLSYSCMPNMKKRIGRHNRSVLNSSPRYVHIQSDNPKEILNNLLLGVQRRLSTISSSKEEFDAAAPPYQAALATAGHGH